MFFNFKLIEEWRELYDIAIKIKELIRYQNNIMLNEGLRLING